MTDEISNMETIFSTFSRSENLILKQILNCCALPGFATAYSIQCDVIKWEQFCWKCRLEQRYHGI